MLSYSVLKQSVTVASASGRILITAKSLQWPRTFMASHAAPGVCNYGTASLVERPGFGKAAGVTSSRFSAIHTLKAKAKGGEEIQRFPPQRQETQPGKEYLMKPLPQFSNPHYRPSGKLQGKVVLVTGGDSGIGRAVCCSFAKEGATVAFTYVKGDEDRDAEDTLKIIHKSKVSDSSDPTAIPADLGYNDNCKNVVDEVVRKYGHIDVLVNNPAVQFTTDSLEVITEERLERVFRTNIFSYFFMTRHALKHMKEGSCIINTTSVLGYTGSPKWLDYSSTKGAIVSFTRGLSTRLVGKGIRVNGVAPGPVWTPLQVSAIDNAEDITTFGSEVPMDRAAQPFEIAPSYVFLASEDSSYFTGQVLHPNGGVIVNA